MKYLLSLLVSIALLTIAGLSCFHYAISNVAYTPGAFSMFENTNAISTGYVHGPWNEKKIQASTLNFIFDYAKKYPETYLTHIVDKAVIKYDMPSSIIWRWHSMFHKYT